MVYFIEFLKKDKNHIFYNHSFIGIMDGNWFEGPTYEYNTVVLNWYKKDKKEYRVTLLGEL